MVGLCIITASPAAAAAAAPTVRLTPPTLPLPLRPPCCAGSLGSRRRSPQPPLATAADAPRGGPIPEPEEVDQHFLAALRAARVRDEESRRSGFFFLTTFHALLVD